MDSRIVREISSASSPYQKVSNSIASAEEIEEQPLAVADEPSAGGNHEPQWQRCAGNPGKQRSQRPARRISADMTLQQCGQCDDDEQDTHLEEEDRTAHQSHRFRDEQHEP